MNIAMGVRGNKERKGGREGWKMESSR